MRIKKEFLNEQSLKPYGFKKEVPYTNDLDICEYEREDEYATTLIQRCDGDVAIVVPDDCDCVDIPDVVYHLIKDGLVEAKDFQKRDIYPIDKLVDQVEALTKENAQLKEQLVEEKRLVADIARNFAFHRAYELAPHDKSEIFFMSLNRVDSDGYHFSYELDDDSKHTICVKHTDLR